MANIINFAPGYYPNPTSGKPISNGYIYVGDKDTDPEIVSNQKQLSAIQEDTTTVLVDQPIRTSAGGVPIYNGSPVTLTVEGEYSLKVLNSYGVQAYYIPSITDYLLEADLGTAAFVDTGTGAAQIPLNSNFTLPYSTYSDTVDYVVGAESTGSDGVKYECMIANGPSSTVVSPISDATGTWAYALRGLPGQEFKLGYEPTNTQLIQMRALQRNGVSVLDADYPGILAFWGSKLYGNADATHFYLPDDSGKFERIYDDGAGVDLNAATRTDRGDGTTGDAVGTNQAGQNKAHNHSLAVRLTGLANSGLLTAATLSNVTAGNVNYADSNPAEGYNGTIVQPDGGSQNNPVNTNKFGGIFY